jgi:16S rRNA (guanine527-N7)-methyltransferase
VGQGESREHAPEAHDAAENQTRRRRELDSRRYGKRVVARPHRLARGGPRRGMRQWDGITERRHQERRWALSSARDGRSSSLPRMSTRELTPPQVAQLATFADLVATSPHNLVSRRARSELRSRHVPEAVELARMLPDGPAKMLDIGSGGGFPGLVVAIVRPDLEVHLLDATRKKVAFLREAVEELGLDTHVHHGRAEELARDPAMAGQYAVVTARAVAALRDLVALTVPFLAPGGVVYAVKGERWRQELDAAAPALRAAQASVLATPDDDLPGTASSEGHRPRVVMLGRSR